MKKRFQVSIECSFITDGKYRPFEVELLANFVFKSHMYGTVEK